ncbi:type IV secretion system DNA-binding domain-containing protein [Flavobacterium sp.]|jgi:hypothetical protein|uniref:type IV secretory system conjugative DNA transfer family protein n=1 Tax=Flavobacterium sp. TaxID=239 RepID=UPI0037C1070C
MKTAIVHFNKNLPLWKIKSLDLFWAGDYIMADTTELTQPMIVNHISELDKKLSSISTTSIEYVTLLKKRFLSFSEYEILSKSAKNTKNPNGISIHAINYWELLKKSSLKHLLYNATDDAKNYLELLQKYLPKPYAYFFSPRPVPVPISALNRHLLITGRTGSGKTHFIKSLFYQLQEQTAQKKSSSLILIDPHGDISSELLTLRLNLKNPERLWYVDPHLDSKLIPCINPFWDKVTDPVFVDLLSQQWAKAFADLIPEAGISLNMETLLKPCLCVLIENGGFGLMDLKNFMDDTLNSELVELGKKSRNPVFRGFFEQGFLNKKLALTKLAVYNRLQFLMNNYIFYQMMNGPCTIDLKKAMQDGKVVLFNLSKGKLGEDSSRAMGRFISATILSIALQRAFEDESTRGKTYLFVDEFHNLASSSMETVFSEARKYNLHMIVGVQSVSQLPSSLKEMVLNNTAVKLVGINGLPALKLQAPDIGVSFSELQNLPPFYFYLKYDHHPALKVKSPDFLIKNHKVYFALPKEVKSIKEFCLHQSGIYRNSELPVEDKTKKTTQTSPDSNQNHKTPKESYGDFMPKFDL